MKENHEGFLYICNSMLIKNLAIFIKDLGEQTYNILTRSIDDEPLELMGDVIEPIDPDEENIVHISTREYDKNNCVNFDLGEE